MPIQDPVEMGMTLPEVTARLEATDFYPSLFTSAFGTPEVTSARVSQALAQFVRSIVSANSRYDVARQAQGGAPGRTMAGLTAQENQGLGLFFGRGQCAKCHSTDLFVGDPACNSGLDATVTDIGRGGGRFRWDRCATSLSRHPVCTMAASRRSPRSSITTTRASRPARPWTAGCAGGTASRVA